MNFKAYKVKLHPNNKQMTRMLNIGFTNLYLYNCLCLLFVEQSNKKIKQDIIFKYPNVFELRKTFTIVKEHLNKDKSKELNDYGKVMYEYMEEYFKNRNYDIYSISNDTLKQTIKDFDRAMKDFFKGIRKAPVMKKFSISNISFYVDPYKVEISSNHLKLEKLVDSRKNNRQELNRVKLAEVSRIPYSTNKTELIKYYNPRVKYDGVNWWISIGVESNNNKTKITSPQSDEVIGIDMGIKQTYLSNGISYQSINRSKKIKLLEKKLHRLQRSLCRKLLKNERVTKNAKKDLKKIRKIQIKLSNLRKSHQEKILKEIKNINPRKIIIEDLDVKTMMKNKHLSKKISEERFYNLRLKIKELCDKLHIIFEVANKYYPSSKMCSSCGNKREVLRLSDRIYKCECCGLVIDRDYNAAINLAMYKN